MNKLSDRRVRHRISPIQMNSGNDARPHNEICDQIVVAMAGPMGRDVNSAMAKAPAISSAVPIHTPTARHTTRMAAKSRAMLAGSIC